MKLLHRFLLLVLTCVSTWLVILSWLPPITKEHRELVVVPDFRLDVAKTIRGLPDECRFSENEPPRKGLIDTFDLLSDVGKGRKYGKRVRPNRPNERNETLKVILIPHTHLDPGWLKPVEEYYKQQVKHILDTLVIKMSQHTEMTFVWAEVVFLDMWWRDTTDDKREVFKKLVQNGRVEITNGGWVAPDEALTSYHALIDQLIEGHDWVLRHLGVKPRTGWSPDPFGYSATIPYLFSRCGIKEMVIVRVHDHIKARLRSERNLEYQWRQPWDSRSDQNDALCHIMPFLYNSFTHSCGPDGDICGKYDFKDKGKYINEFNLRKYAEELTDQFEKKSQLYRHNVIFHTIGGDFRFDTPQEWDDQFVNYQQISNYININKTFNMEIKFGTAADYFNAVKMSTKSSGGFGILHGDWIPYYDVGQNYWTGFFTTRPFLKRLGRELEGELRAAEILNSLSNAYQTHFRSTFTAMNEILQKLTKARRELAVFQHHDAITGTSTERTVRDYEKRLWRAKDLVRIISATAASYLLSEGTYQGKTDPILYPLNYRKEKAQLESKNTLAVFPDKTTLIALFNPSAQFRKELIRLHVNSSAVTVTDAYNKVIACQMNPVWVRFKQTSTHMVELLFYADLAPLSLTTYSIQSVKSNSTTIAKVNIRKKEGKGDAITRQRKGFGISSKNLHVEFGPNGLLKYVQNLKDKEGMNISTRFHRYIGSSRSGGGAYIFAGGRLSPIGDPKFVIEVKGPLMSLVRVGFGIIEHNIRIFHSECKLGAALEIENYVDMTKITENSDLLMRFDTTIKNDEYLYTDSNGYQMFRRERQASFPMSGNIYPISDACYIQDNITRLSVLAGQPHGVASLQSGQLDVFLDRKLFRDDGKGLGEGVKDNVPAMSKFFLLLERPKGVDLAEVRGVRLPYQSMVSHSLLEHLLHPVVDFLATRQINNLQPVFNLLRVSLPCDVHLVNLKTMQPRANASENDLILILHRRVFHCAFPVYDLNCPLTSGRVDLHLLFKDIRFESVQEMSLSLMYEKGRIRTKGQINLQPMEIAAYKLKIGHK